MIDLSELYRVPPQIQTAARAWIDYAGERALPMSLSVTPGKEPCAEVTITHPRFPGTRIMITIQLGSQTRVRQKVSNVGPYSRVLTLTQARERLAGWKA